MPINILWRRWAFVSGCFPKNRFSSKKCRADFHAPFAFFFFPGFRICGCFFRLKISGLRVTGNKSWTRLQTLDDIIRLDNIQNNDQISKTLEYLCKKVQVTRQRIAQLIKKHLSPLITEKQKSNKNGISIYKIPSDFVFLLNVVTWTLH